MTSVTSCEDDLDIPQHGVLDYSSYYQTDEQFETAVNALYLELKGTYYNYTMLKGCLSDDVWSGGGVHGDNAELDGCNEFTFDAEQSFIRGVWESYYKIIYKANVVLGHIAEGTSSVGDRARAEAKVFRAFAYFDLISMWGEPPLVDHELAPAEYSVPNGKPEELWALVENDLKEAIASGYLAEKTNADDNTTWRLTKQFAQAMLGKAYLWQNKYSEAAEQFNAVRKSGKYRLFDGAFEDMLTYKAEYNCESMLESNRIFDANNNMDEFSFYEVMNHWRTDRMTVAADIQGTGWGFMCPRKDLYDAFVAEEGVNGYRLTSTMKTYDQLKETGSSINAGQTMINEGYFMWKRRFTLEESKNGFWVSYNNYRWMRYAEVLLLAAEANFQAGNKSEADACLNEVRTRAKLSPKSNATIEDIKLEKRLELCCEYTRFQDLLRWGEAEARMGKQGEKCPILNSSGVVTYESYNSDPSKYGFKARHNRLPIPAVECRLNSAINQNPGW